MDKSEKQFISNIELDNDFGDINLNNFYNNLDSETKAKLEKYKKEIKINILKKMIDPEIQKYYKGLDEETRKKLDNVPIRDKYAMIETLVKKQIKEKPDDILETKPNEPTQDEIEKYYKTLDEETKKKLDNLPTRDKYLMLRMLKKQEIKENPKDIFESNKYAPTQADIDRYHKIIGNSNVFTNFNPQDKTDIPPNNLYVEAPQEMFEESNLKENEEKEKIPNQQRFDKIVKLYLLEKKQPKGFNIEPELEVRFGTKGIKKITKTDYDNVVKKLKSSGFYPINNNGDYSLKINCEYLDPQTGRFKISENIRTEITSLHSIEQYCKSNDLKDVYNKNPSCVSFINKKRPFINERPVYPVDFNDFNFRVSYMNEETAKIGIKNFIIDNWKKTKKEFRFINRVTLVNDNLPFKVDLSIVKYGNKETDRYGRPNRGRIHPVYTLNESNVFNNEEVYEIEIEADNTKIGYDTKYSNSENIANMLRNTIKLVLCGLQNTNFPVSYPEQKLVLNSYMRLIWGNNYNEEKQNIVNKNFIGPSSITLQMTNISEINENSKEPNIRKNFVVTEKADGIRNLLFINSDGKIYLINMNMDVIFTGAKTTNQGCFNSLLDGELILHDKKGKFINLFAAFDIYYMKKEDIRHLSFMNIIEENNLNKSRYYNLKNFINILNPVSILDNGNKTSNKSSIKEILNVYKNNESIISPITIKSKEFLPLSSKQTIFNACNTILTKQKENRFEYETDGLIFTHAYYGVGSDKIGESGPKTKITWRNSFKWKPPKYNTIDFLVTTLKGQNGDDVIKPVFEDGISSNLSSQLSEFKVIQLRCGFSEKNDGFLNPCQDIIDDKLPEYKVDENDRDNDYLPTQFYPSEPYDPKAGISNIMLRTDGSGTKQMFTEENQVFTDNTIVEFSYDFTKETGWRWVPLRVRYDKTSEYLKGERQYGNSYTTANENWKSIHNPITQDMLITGMNIPDILVSEDIYYNKPIGKMFTESMKNFHNLYVKKMLITAVSKPGNTLIDFACGKAGDLSKWISAKLSFVFGIDYSLDNLENRKDGACARYLKLKKINKNMPYALFVNGNSSYNIKNGNALLNDKAKQITLSVFGVGSKDPEKIGKGVARQYGVGESGFDVSSCQFALHYFFENPDSLQGFVKNIAECTKLNGYFIGTAYDGKLLFNMLKKVKTNESVQINIDDKKIWELTKRYGSDIFEDNSSCIGYKIDVYQESINNTISEYLINFDYFERIMEAYGFKLISRDEAKELGLPEGSGLFSELFVDMLEEIKRNKYKAKDYGIASLMNEYEKKISFLNRYFVYKKIMEVNTEKVEIELGEYNETENLRNSAETINAITIAKNENTIIKPKIRKLNKKLLLIPATEAIDEVEIVKEPIKQIIKKKKVEQKKEKKLLIVEDSDSDK